MKTRLQRIEIRNFKIFRCFNFDFQGKHLLVYGSNGSGKSSLYWALHCFLESGGKETREVAKYFDPTDAKSLLNIHEADYEANPGEIKITLRDTSTRVETTYPISLVDHSTRNNPTIVQGGLGSDFITYRFFFGFAHFRGSSNFDLWPLFDAEILPFCVTTGGVNPSDLWRRIRLGNPNPLNERGLAGKRGYEAFHENVKSFATILDGIVESISAEAQRFYDRHFAAHDPKPVTLKLGVTKKPTSSGTNWQEFRFQRPVIQFAIQIAGKTIDCPQVYLNEAKLTQLALSVRFAASLVNLHQSDLKLLVLDDLLVSLDMSNRIRVIELLMSSEFDGYQKLIFTHDRGLYHEVRRYIGVGHPDWRFCRMRDKKLEEDKTDLQLAQQYLANDQLSDCGCRLREYVEDVLSHFLSRAKDDGLTQIIERGDFESLAIRIREARKQLAPAAAAKIENLILAEITDEEWAAILGPVDPASIHAADREEKGKIVARLVSAQTALLETIRECLKQSSRHRQNAEQILADIEKIKDRILNPAAHAGEAPLFTGEVEHAVGVIGQLESALQLALRTLPKSKDP